jgi:hypothetical protein
VEPVFFETVFRALHRAQVRYLVVGGVAVNLHGVPRLTKDLDVMLDWSADNATRFIECVEAMRLAPRAPVPLRSVLDAANRKAWRDEKGALVFTVAGNAPPYDQVDVFLDNPIDFAEAYARRTDIPVADFIVPVVAIGDLIALKEAAGRLQDQADVAMLRKLENERKDT